MPGIKFDDWVPVTMEARTTKQGDATKAIGDYLTRLPPETTKVSIRSLREVVKLGDLSSALSAVLPPRSTSQGGPKPEGHSSGSKVNISRNVYREGKVPAA